MQKSIYLMVAGALTLGACSRSSNSAAAPTPASSASADVAGDGRGPGRGMGGRREEMLMRGIQLSDAQRAQIDSIRARYRAQYAGSAGARNDDVRPDPEARRQMMETMQKQMSEVRAVLTDEQRAQFDKNMEEMRNRRGRGGPGGGTPPAA